MCDVLQLQQKLEEAGVTQEVKLSWRRSPDGNIFTREEEEELRPRSVSGMSCVSQASQKCLRRPRSVSGVSGVSLQQAGTGVGLVFFRGLEQVQGLFVDQSPEVLEGDVVPALHPHLIQDLDQPVLRLHLLQDAGTHGFLDFTTGPSEDQTLRGPDPRRIRPSEDQTLRPSEDQTLRGSDPQTLRGPDPRRIRPSEDQTLGGSDPQRTGPSEDQTLGGSDPQRIRPSEDQTLGPSEDQTLRGPDPQTLGGPDPQCSS
ncbi:hypothetical protein JOQ06_024366 [Pogonophryne albipinna]|uniref:Uncharacterized protein n=1 Tax=Pogonophryne albipinna TaxID=1090488 RepID=A0AAD6ADF6_9TELE|nr:hypothetical protein JOQ06_024366 [Pogonophryne albipinna]